jgi:hypothetical protein
MSMRRRLREGLVAAWSPAVSRATGLSLLDLSGNGRHAPAINVTPSTQYLGLKSYDAFYRSTSAQDGVFRATNLPPISVEFSFVVFAETSQTTDNRNLFCLGVSNNTNPFFGVGSNATNTLFYANGMTNITIAEPTNEINTFVFAQDSETRRRAYLNTSETVDTTSLTGRTFTQANFFHFASNGSSVNFDRWQGYGLDFRIYRRALSAEEVKALHEYGPGYGLRPEPTRVYFGGALAEPPTPTFKPYWRQSPQLSTAGVIG